MSPPAFDEQHPLAIYGARGLLGRQLAVAYLESAASAEGLRLFTGQREVEESLEFGDETLHLEHGVAKGLSVAVLCVPEAAAKSLAPALAESGAWVIDASAATSGALVCPGVDHRQASPSGKLLMLAHPATRLVLKLLTSLPQVRAAHVTLLCSAATAGQEGVVALDRDTSLLLSGLDAEVKPFPHRLAFNIIPGVGELREGGTSTLEARVKAEVAQLWPRGDAPKLAVTSLWVPLFHGLMALVHVDLETPVTAEAARAALRSTSEVKVVDDSTTHLFPMPMLTANDSSLLVGRVSAEGHRLTCIACEDSTIWAAEALLQLAQALGRRVSGTDIVA